MVFIPDIMSSLCLVHCCDFGKCWQYKNVTSFWNERRIQVEDKKEQCRVIHASMPGFLQLHSQTNILCMQFSFTACCSEAKAHTWVSCEKSTSDERPVAKDFLEQLGKTTHSESWPSVYQKQTWIRKWTCPPTIVGLPRSWRNNELHSGRTSDSTVICRCFQSDKCSSPTTLLTSRCVSMSHFNLSFWKPWPVCYKLQPYGLRQIICCQMKWDFSVEKPEKQTHSCLC